MRNELMDSRMIRPPAMMIIVPSMADDMISIFPCPNGWERSGGCAER